MTKTFIRKAIEEERERNKFLSYDEYIHKYDTLEEKIDYCKQQINDLDDSLYILWIFLFGIVLCILVTAIVMLIVYNV